MYKHGLICGRYQPLHHGHINLIRKALSECETLTIAVGSSQDEVNDRNPYNYNQRYMMLASIFKRELLSSKIHIIPIWDINNPPMWVDHILAILKFQSYSPCTVDAYFSGSEKDAYLFKEKGIPTVILDREKLEYKSGTEIRDMVKNKNEEWKNHVPKENWVYVDWWK